MMYQSTAAGSESLPAASNLAATPARYCSAFVFLLRAHGGRLALRSLRSACDSLLETNCRMLRWGQPSSPHCNEYRHVSMQAAHTQIKYVRLCRNARR